MTLAEAAREFLAQKRIAVVGVSRHPDQAANYVFRKLRAAGREVFPVNRRAASVEGVRCYPELRSISDGVDAVVGFIPAKKSAALVQECADLGIGFVWLHQGLGPGSVSDKAIEVARTTGVTLIPGGCPAMFCAPVDLPHRCMRWVLSATGRLPREVVPVRRDASAGVA
jgi:uncharacterized protein